jgi:hypothetical protein
VSEFGRPRASTRLVVVGKTGTGKSSRVKKALRAWLTEGVRVVVVDPCDEYSREGRARHGLAAEGPLRQRMTALELSKRPQVMTAPRLELAVVPDEPNSPASIARAFLLAKRLVLASGRPTLLVADEVGWWTNSSAHPKCHAARVELGALAATGRKEGVALVTVSQCAAHIPPDVRKQSDEWWAFLQDDPTDVDALSERLGKENAEAVSRLPQFEFHHWRDATHQPTKAPLRAV